MKFNNETKFLITGGAGFIGSNLCEKLVNDGYQVICLDNLSTGKMENIKFLLNKSNFKFIEGDITNLDTCLKASKGVNYILHQAAWGSVPRSIKMPLEYEEINIRGTLNVFEAARINKVQRVIFASSSSVYGDSPILPKVEHTIGNVLSPYALTKKVDEEYARLYNNLYRVETVGLRYFNVFGAKQDANGMYAAVIPKFIKAILNNEQPIIFGDGLTSRDFTYIENVIEANLKACLAPKAAGEVFNIAYGGQVTLNQLFEVLTSLLGSNLKPTYTEERAGDIKHSNANIDKARKLLNYEPKFNVKEGLKLAIDWYKNNL